MPSPGSNCRGEDLFVYVTMVCLCPTKLEEKRTGSVYRNRLQAGFSALSRWLQLRSAEYLEGLASNSISPLVVDQLLAEFVTESHEQGHKFWIVKHAVLSAQTRFRHYRGKIPRAWDCLSSWEATRPFRSRTPIGRDLVYFLSAVAFSWGVEVGSRANHMLPMSILLRVGYHGLLRPGEIANLRVEDVSVSLSVYRPNAVLAIRSPKTRNWNGRHQFVLIEDLSTVQWLKWLVDNVPKTTKVWTGSAATFRTSFLQLTQRAGLETLRLSPAGLRAGGVTDMIRSGADVGRVRFLGRWRAEGTMIAYIQESMSAHVWNAVDPSLRSLILSTNAESVQFLKAPPLAP